jgi:succinoglycan biosynthesis protein ExoV
MPHFELGSPDVWRMICEGSDICFIDPRASVEEVSQKISETDVLITECLHGAVVADSLRVPWIPVVSSGSILRFKWADWCMSVGLEYHPTKLSPLVFFEPDKLNKLIYCVKKLAGGRNTDWAISQLRVTISGKRRGNRLAELRSISKQANFLSREKRFQDILSEVHGKIDEFRADFDG